MRSTLTTETLALAEEYAQEALQWMIEDRIATEVTAKAELDGVERLNLMVEIVRPDQKTLTARFVDVWSKL